MVLYRMIQAVILPVMALRAVWLWLTGALTGPELRQSLWRPEVQGPAVWVHGASLGEVQSVRAVVEWLCAQGPVLLTTTRAPAKRAAESWGLSGLSVALAPLDSGWITRAVLRRCLVTRLVIVENELWPARIAACHAAGVPVVLLSARMSARSARRWGRANGLARALLGPVRLVVPQDAGSASRFAALGVAEGRIAAPVKLKAGYLAPSVTVPPELAEWAEAPVALVAATHAGEEEIVLAAYAQARATRPDLRLILAPRHAERGADVAALVVRAGLSCARRDLGETPNAPVYLADTTGEMALWYTLADVAFVGGSLVPKGGHTPYEPAAHGCPILHGPHVANFAEDYAAFDAGRAAIPVKDAATLAAALLAHLGDSFMADRARALATPPDVAALARAILDA